MKTIIIVCIITFTIIGGLNQDSVVQKRENINAIFENPPSIQLIRIGLDDALPYIEAEITNTTPMIIRVSKYYNYMSSLTVLDEEGNSWSLERDPNIQCFFDLQPKDCIYKTHLNPYQTKAVKLLFRFGYQFHRIVQEDMQKVITNEIVFSGTKDFIRYYGTIYINISDEDLKVFKMLPIYVYR